MVNNKGTNKIIRWPRELHVHVIAQKDVYKVAYKVAYEVAYNVEIYTVHANL